MSIPKTLNRQRDFTGGELDPEAERRSDLEVVASALKRARNVRPLDVGGLRRRSGRRVVYFDGGKHDLVRPISNAIFDVTFAPGRFTARLLNGGVVANITGCPWTADILTEISWEPFGKRIYVTARGMRTQYVQYDADSGTWALFDYEFEQGQSGRYAAPFRRFAAAGITMTPSALSGNITLRTGAPVFVAGHVGVLMTYVDRQMRITAVISPTEARATTIEPLPPTYRVSVSSTAGFVAGETVEGDTSNTEGEVVAVNGGSLDVVVINNFGGFEADEFVVGANGRGKVSGSSTISPGASVQWAEQFMSDLRGWPGAVSSAFQRLIFCDFPQNEQAIIASAIGAEQDVETTKSDADAAIFTYVPVTCRVFQVIEGSDLFVLTDRGPFYVPVSESTPLTQGNTRFRKIDATAAANVRAVFAQDAIIFVGQEAQRIFSISPTGAEAQPYGVTPLSDYHSHLFTNPISIAVGEGSPQAPGRHLYVVNEDGSTVVGRYRAGENFVGWFPWDGTGKVTAVCAGFGSVLFSVLYPAAEVVETIDDTMAMDGSIALSDFEGNDAIQTSTGEAIQTSTGETIVTGAGALIPFAGVTMFGWADGFFLGPIAVDADGRVDFPENYTERVVGWPFTPEVEPFIPTFEGGQFVGQASKPRRVSQVTVTFRDTTTFIADGHSMGHEFATYHVGDDQGQPRPPRDETRQYRQIGRRFDPSVNIQQPVPGTFTLIELTVEVTI